MDGEPDSFSSIANALGASLEKWWGYECNQCPHQKSMSGGKRRTWIWAAVVLVVIQVVGLFGLLEMRRGESEREREWAFDPEAAVAEAKGEKEFREALQNLPMLECVGG